MARLGDYVSVRTRVRDPIQLGDRTITLQSRAVSLRWPGGGWVWNRPVAALVERDGQVVRLCKSFVCARIPFAPGAEDTTKYGVAGTPTYVIVENDGTEVARHQGFARPSDFSTWLRNHCAP